MPDNTVISVVALMITIAAAAGGLATLILTGLKSINARITETGANLKRTPQRDRHRPQTHASPRPPPPSTHASPRPAPPSTLASRTSQGALTAWTVTLTAWTVRLDRMEIRIDTRFDSLDTRLCTIETTTAELRACLLPRSKEFPQPSPGND